jgi:hypothetical protein
MDRYDSRTILYAVGAFCAVIIAYALTMLYINATS